MEGDAMGRLLATLRLFALLMMAMALAGCSAAEDERRQEDDRGAAQRDDRRAPPADDGKVGDRPDPGDSPIAVLEEIPMRVRISPIREPRKGMPDAPLANSPVEISVPEPIMPRSEAPEGVPKSAGSSPRLRVQPMEVARPKLGREPGLDISTELRTETFPIELPVDDEGGEIAEKRLAAVTEKEDFAVVKVFYGTDRARLGGPSRVRYYLFGAAALSLMFSTVLVWRGVKSQNGCWPIGMAIILFFASAGLAGLAGLDWLIIDSVGDDVSITYGGERGDMALGVCEVSIPQGHQTGKLENPSILRLELKAAPERHVVLLDVLEKPADDFYDELRRCVSDSEKKQCFVFVHGYNTKFEDAVRRSAQLAYDLNFDGAPICFSWPSEGELWGYHSDQNDVAWAESDLRQFLHDVAANSQAESIHIIAHSMGNRVVTEVLKTISLEMKLNAPLFDEVVLTAPDIDADYFQRDIAPYIVHAARRVTLYASSNDKALMASQEFHGGKPRAGDSGETLLLLPGIQTIDVSAVDTSFLGHSYFGSNDTVIADLWELIETGKSADHRTWLQPTPFGQQKYWVFLRERLGQRRTPSHAIPIPVDDDGDGNAEQHDTPIRRAASHAELATPAISDKFQPLIAEPPPLTPVASPPDIVPDRPRLDAPVPRPAMPPPTQAAPSLAPARTFAPKTPELQPSAPKKPTAVENRADDAPPLRRNPLRP
jgi:esterase/lipase superfamily enzyme